MNVFASFRAMIFSFLTLILIILAGSASAQKIFSAAPALSVAKCHDFDINGAGSSTEWQKASWHQVIRLDSAAEHYATRFKILYSGAGIYVLFEGEDKKITTTYDQDFQDLYNADVFEVFFQPDTTMPLYLEYEINALDKELVLLIPNLGRVSGWTPFHYEGKRVKKMVHLVGGKMEKGASIQSWSAELFFPYAIFEPLLHMPPVSGTVWHANFYRLDYDSGPMVKWAWSPIEHHFHEFKRFGSIIFE